MAQTNDQVNSTAYLSSSGEYTTFTVGDRTITFLTSRNLERYTRILGWDSGNITVMSKNFGKAEREDYIDLNPILENLMLVPEEFLKTVREVKIRYV